MRRKSGVNHEEYIFSSFGFVLVQLVNDLGEVWYLGRILEKEGKREEVGSRGRGRRKVFFPVLVLYSFNW
jgi:hypothetical protein